MNLLSGLPTEFLPVVRAKAGLLALIPAVVLAPASTLAQRPLHGVVADQATLSLIDSARVTVVGTELEAVTGGDGTFSFEGVPLGALAVRIEAPGYPVVVEQVEVVRDVVLYMQVMMPGTDGVLGGLAIFSGFTAIATVSARADMRKVRQRMELARQGLLDRLERGENPRSAEEPWHRKLLR